MQRRPHPDTSLTAADPAAVTVARSAETGLAGLGGLWIERLQQRPLTQSVSADEAEGELWIKRLQQRGGAAL